MYLKEYHRIMRTNVSTNKSKKTLDLEEARRLHKSRNETLSKEKRSTIRNEISLLETTWRQMKFEKTCTDVKNHEVPRTRICLAVFNDATKTPKAKPKLKTITISTCKHSVQVMPCRQDFSPSKSTPGKWKKQVNTTPSKEGGCSSPIKKYLNRFREITREAEFRQHNSTLEIQDIMLKQTR